MCDWVLFATVGRLSSPGGPLEFAGLSPFSSLRRPQGPRKSRRQIGSQRALLKSTEQSWYPYSNLSTGGPRREREREREKKREREREKGRERESATCEDVPRATSCFTLFLLPGMNSDSLWPGILLYPHFFGLLLLSVVHLSLG